MRQATVGSGHESRNTQRVDGRVGVCMCVRGGRGVHDCGCVYTTLGTGEPLARSDHPQVPRVNSSQSQLPASFRRGPACQHAVRARVRRRPLHAALQASAQSSHTSTTRPCAPRPTCCMPVPPRAAAPKSAPSRLLAAALNITRAGGASAGAGAVLRANSADTPHPKTPVSRSLCSLPCAPVAGCSRSMNPSCSRGFRGFAAGGKAFAGFVSELPPGPADVTMNVNERY